MVSTDIYRRSNLSPTSVEDSDLADVAAVSALQDGSIERFGLQVEDNELADVAAVSASNNYEIGNMIAEAMRKLGRKGVVTLEEGRSSDNYLYVVEGMQFDRGYISPYFVTDSEKMTVEYDNCKKGLI